MEPTDSLFPEAKQSPISEELIPATISDLGDIRRLMQEASDFKQSRGDDLWGTAPFTDDEIAKMIESGNMFVYRLEGTMAASVLLTDNDERMWDDQGSDGSAVYVHKLCVGDEFRGQGVGQKVMSVAENYAQENGKTKLRLDCPYDNPALCKYYEELGFYEVKRYDRPNSAGGRSPDKDVYRAVLYEKEVDGSNAGV